jgi:hypothetical protein
MATNFRFKIRRSTSYAGTVSAIPAAVGELVHITTNANNYTTGAGHKVYVGVGTETAGQASAFEAIGGQYYTQLLDSVAGVLSPSAAIITDSNSRITGLNIGNNGTLVLNNTADTFNTSIKAAPGLTASYALTLPSVVGTSGQVLSTDGTGVLSWITSGGNTALIPTNTATAYRVWDGTEDYIKIDTVTGASVLQLGNTLTTQNNIVKTNTAGAYNITDGTNNFFKIDTTSGSQLTTIGFGNAAITNNLAVNGGTISTTATTANLLNTGATTVNFAGAGTTVVIGATSGTTTVRNDLVVTGALTVNGGSTLINATNLSVQDPIIEYGRINGAAPTSSTTFDLGNKFNYFDTSARISTFFYQRSSGNFVLAKNATEAANVLTVATPTTSVTDYGTLVLGSVLVNDQACSTLGVAEQVIAYRTINGTTGRFIDGVIADGGIFS